MPDETDPIDIPAIAHALNERAAGHAIGRIQDIRARLKSHSRRAGSVIFSSQTTFPTYAFHHGGRPELQFNIGTEFAEDGLPELRHGVAFSLEPSRTLPNIRELFPKVALFNSYMDLYPDLFPDMALWHHRGADLLADRPPGPIPPHLLKPYVFIVLGKRQSAGNPDFELILDDFDRLLPLYQFVESGGETEPVASAVTPFEFKPGFVERKASAVVTRTPREVNVILRHTLIQKALYRRLVTEHGDLQVRAEQGSGVGTFVDVVVRRPGEAYWFYEIKTARSARACVRDALGQLLEYSNWPGSPQVERLIVVGEAPLVPDTAEYLRRLRERFGFPLDYEQVALGR